MKLITYLIVPGKVFEYYSVCLYVIQYVISFAYISLLRKNDIQTLSQEEQTN